MISKENEKEINKLIKKGWEFMIIWTSDDFINKDLDKKYSYNANEFHWEVDFTKRKRNGLWDNHKPGHSSNDLNEAIAMAIDNVKNHKRLGK